MKLLFLIISTFFIILNSSFCEEQVTDYETIIKERIKKLESQRKPNQKNLSIDKAIKNLQNGELTVYDYGPEDSWKLVEINITPKSGKHTHQVHSKSLINGKPRSGETRIYISSQKELFYTDIRKYSPTRIFTRTQKITVTQPPPASIKPGELYIIATRVTNTASDLKGPVVASSPRATIVRGYGRSLRASSYMGGRVPIGNYKLDGTSDTKNRLGVKTVISDVLGKRVTDIKNRFLIEKRSIPYYFHIYINGSSRFNHQISYVYKYNGKSKVERKPDKRKLAIQALDANPLFNENILPTELKPTQLIKTNTQRLGTTADGVSQLIIRAELTSDSSAEFSLESKEDGTLTPLLDGKTITLAGKHYAFSLYTPPAAFNSDKDPPKALFKPEMAPKKRLKNILEYRDIKINVTEKSSNKKASITLKLSRPPVVLVHGLGSDAHECWVVTKPNGTSMVSLLEKAGLLPFTVSYQKTNGFPGNGAGSSFRANATVVWDRADPFVDKQAAEKKPKNFVSPMARLKLMCDQVAQERLYPEPALKNIYSLYQKAKPNRMGGIKHALEYYRSEFNLAATQADVIGHSMGGILARCYASEEFNPNYKRAVNYHLGDINRLITLNSPHYGSELPHLHNALTKVWSSSETWSSWFTRMGAVAYAYVYLGTPTPAVRDLTAPQNKTEQKKSALAKIGQTKIPSFAIATTVDTNQLGSSEFDHVLKYRRLYGTVSMIFFYNRPLLDDFLHLRFNQYQSASGALVSPEKSITKEEYLRIIHDSIDQNAIYWARHRELKYREGLIKHLEESLIVPFGTIDNNRSETIVKETFDPYEYLVDTAIKTAIGGDIKKLKEPHSDQDVPASTIGLIRSLIYHNDPKNDGAVRVVSQLGGLPKKSTKIIGEQEQENGIIHSYSPWHYRVQREVITLLKWQNGRFEQSGFGVAGEIMPRYLPSSDLIKPRTGGEKAVRWSGVVPSHAKAYAAVADEQQAVILVRPVNRDSTELIKAHNATKAMAVKGKSSNWGPQKGFIPVQQRFSKIWQVHKENPETRAKQIIKYDKITQKVLLEDHPTNIGKKYVKPANLFHKGNPVFAIPAKLEPDAEKAIVIETKKGYTDLKGGSISLTQEQKNALKPLQVLAVDLELEKPRYVTADYDLLAIGIYNEAIVNSPSSYKDKPIPAAAKAAKAKFDPLFGAITEDQKKIIKALNDRVKATGYNGGKVTHHGPEVQYPDSPYVDYPILVCDPGEPKVQGDQSVFIIHQGPPGFRDIHLKRYFASRIKKGYHLWSNPHSKGWLWQKHRDFSIATGYDPSDAPNLLPYVKEQTDPDLDPKKENQPPNPTPPTRPAPTPRPPNKSIDPLLAKKLMLVKQLHALADNGDTKAQIKLAKMYLSGIGGRRNKDRFRKLVKDAMDGGDIDGEVLYAEALLLGYGGLVDEKGAMNILINVWKKDEHHPRALFLAAAIYVDGRGVPKDEKKGMKYLKESAKLNYPPANFYYGLKFIETHPKEAMEYVKKSATLGFHAAHYFLAEDAINGKNGEKNPALAIKHYLKAAEDQDYRDGFNYVGNLYFEGAEGVAKNRKLAVHFYRLGSKASDASARFKLARCYRKGQGVPRDIVVSQAWYQFATYGTGASLEDKEIIKNAKELTPEQLNEAIELSEQWKKKHP